MSKQEFLRGLEEALLEQMSISEAAPHIRYYQDYIESEVRKGRTEEEVIASLSNPRLIAKTIINNGGSAKKYDNTVYEGNGQAYNNSSNYDNGSGNSSFSFSINGKPVNSLVAKIIIGLILLLILTVILVIVGGVLWIISKIILPVILIVGVIYIVMKLARSGRL